jgi:hypothetical protein
MASARDATNTRWVVCLFAGIVHAEALQEPVKAEVLFKEVLRVALRPCVLSCSRALRAATADGMQHDTWHATQRPQ